MRVLLDTSTFLFALESPGRLSAAARRVFSKSSFERELSVISFVEIAIKRESGKFTFTRDDVRKGINDLELRVLPISEEHAMRMFELPALHPDPFDRQLIAQALAEDIPIVTCDEAFERYRGLKVIW
ncbi:MAG TPA: type II toxin-antitoxin system VapC family toxin [Candidatus Eisenbacteria bacterium]|nr:type II toxin-antitoxin system VapC family toxin [Candidatus Eisenbacteria bacterium]